MGDILRPQKIEIPSKTIDFLIESYKYFDDELSPMLPVNDYFEKLEHEMIKFRQLLRIFIQIQKRIKKHNLKSSKQDPSDKGAFRKIVENYCKVELEQIKMKQFMEMAEYMGVLRSGKREETAYFK